MCQAQEKAVMDSTSGLPPLPPALTFHLGLLHSVQSVKGSLFFSVESVQALRSPGNFLSFDGKPVCQPKGSRAIFEFFLPRSSPKNNLV